MAGTASHITLVTGANQGIGFQTAKRLASEHPDYHVILSGRRQAALDEAVAKLKSQGLDNISSVLMDLSSDASIAAAKQQIESRHGRLDVLVNNAAIGDIPDLSGRGKWQQVYNTNVFGTAAVTDAFIPLLEKSAHPESKRIVFVSSALGIIDRLVKREAGDPATGWAPYASSKTATTMLAAHYIVKYKGDSSWKINVSCPGYCATGLNNFAGSDDASLGALNSVRLATLGADGESGTFTDRHGPLPW